MIAIKKRFIIVHLLLLSTICVAQEPPYFLYTSKDNGLPQTQVMAVEEAEDGCIWVGTYGGVGCFDGKQFRNFTENDGLLSNIVYDLTIYRDTVFVLTRDGVNLIVNDKVSVYFYFESLKFTHGRLFINDHFRLVLSQSIPSFGIGFMLFDLQKKARVDCFRIFFIQNIVPMFSFQSIQQYFV